MATIAAQNILARKLWIKYAINIEVHFGGYLCITDVIMRERRNILKLIYSLISFYVVHSVCGNKNVSLHSLPIFKICPHNKPSFQSLLCFRLNKNDYSKMQKTII
jgi:hypothetical protein